MKRLHIIILAILLVPAATVFSQQQTWTDSLSMQSIERHDGSELRGRVVAMNAREVTIVLADGTRLVLPKHLVRSIIPLDSPQQQSAVSAVQTATYFVTSSALPMPKGTSTLQFNIAGVALEAFPTERLSIGVLSSWISAPIIATAMVRMPVADNVWLGAGGIVGWGGSLADRNFFAAPTLTLTVLSGSTSFSLTGGYGATSLKVETYTQPDYSAVRDTLQVTSPRAYAALGVSLKLARKIRLIVDAFMISGSGSVTLPDGRWVWTDVYNYYDPSSDFTRSFETYSNIFIIPAIRWDYSVDAYWQFGFAGYKGNLLNLEDNSNWSPIPIPVVQWVIAL
ncbi:MAG: hypothetical protein FGM32_01325 [Candidatus Kapabacteria bacterium]|nr:hypothetical protein [Candidatus Kapabacteria bacterium]